MKYYEVIKVIAHCSKWVDLEDTMLNEVSQNRGTSLTYSLHVEAILKVIRMHNTNYKRVERVRG